MNVDVKISPQNLLEEWGNFEDWENGASAAPTEFTLSGTGAAVAREATEIKQGTYSAKITYGSADAQLYYDHPDYESYLGRKVKLGFWVKTAVASQARIKIDDGVNTSQSSYHTGGGGWEFLTVEHDMATNASRLRVICFVDTTGLAYFDGGILCEGDLLFTDLSDGSQFYINRWSASRDIRISDYDPARRHGVILGRPRYDKKPIKMSGQVIGATAAAARSNLETILKAVMAINTLRVDSGLRDLYLYDDRFLRGQPINWEDNRRAALRVIDFDFDFIVPDPFDKYINRQRHVQTITTTPTSFDLTVGGSIFTLPRIYFVASAGDIETITLENLTTGESMSFTETVDNGNTLIIDCYKETVENDGADAISGHSGDFLALLPVTNKLKFTGTDCTIKIDFFNRFL